MKWEILKGSEDDFEGYHEEVTHIYSTRRGRAVSNGVAPSLDGHLVAERRPITEPDVSQQVTTEWSGDGLPPVGAKVMSPSGAAIIDFVGKDVIVYTNSDGQWSVRCDGVHGRLSPLQPENVAREEAISEMLMVEGGMPDSYQPYEFVAALYDAGYRKVE
ncbi:hypothetical protein V2154_13480 [Ewingella sp. CoE-038-23]|uniref:hypothetical protein n=1 Tax=Ewingella docleensis TaxID=3118588 RepID=UPI0033657FF9